MSNEELWEAVLAQIQLTISPANFATWFRGTKIISQKDNQVIISTPNSFVKEWLEQKYNQLIFKILHGLDTRIRGVKYVVGKEGLKIKTPRRLADFGEDNQLEFQEFKIDRETNLNPRYTFESFVVGSFNELAHAAAQATVKNPGSLYNPLFIYGGVGLGKTHLLEAIGNEMTKVFPTKKVRYIPSEKFTRGVVKAIRNQDMEGFKSKYQEIDVLIIDDVQFLAGKEKTQEEFFHTFNALYQKNKQIVLSSDRPPKTIPSLTERLRSRFEGGMIADISLPDLETRVAILKTKSQERVIEFPDEIYNFVAETIQRNVRDLEGALNRLIVYQKVNNRPPDLETARALLKKIAIGTKKWINSKKVLSVVAEFYDLKDKDLFTPSRKNEIVRPRQIAMYLLRTELKNSYPFIGRRFGGKDHSTVIHSCERIARELKEDKNLEEEIELIKQRIYGS
jgi:chromosomal replication initiator protein